MGLIKRDIDGELPAARRECGEWAGWTRLAWRWEYTPLRQAGVPTGRATAPGWPHGWAEGRAVPVEGSSAAEGWWSDGGDAPARVEFGGDVAAAVGAATHGRRTTGSSVAAAWYFE